MFLIILSFIDFNDHTAKVVDCVRLHVKYMSM